MRFAANGHCADRYHAFDWNTLDRQTDHPAALDAFIDGQRLAPGEKHPTRARRITLQLNHTPGTSGYARVEVEGAKVHPPKEIHLHDGPIHFDIELDAATDVQEHNALIQLRATAGSAEDLETHPFTIAFDQQPNPVAIEGVPSRIARLEQLQETSFQLRPTGPEQPLHGTAYLARADEPNSVAGSASFQLQDRETIDLAELAPAALDDGTYTLYLRGTDAARNKIDSTPVTFEVATAGPVIASSSPTPGKIWGSRNGEFSLAVETSDPNGVHSVVATVLWEPPDRPGDQRSYDLQRDPDSDGTWRSLVELPVAWSEQSVTVSIRARDEAGNVRTLDLDDVNLDEIHRTAPQQIEITRNPGPKQISLGPMILVPSGELSYTFGGRRQDREQFADFDLPSAFFDTQLEDDIPDFYLDAREVSVAQFMAFVRDLRSGWRPPNGSLDKELRSPSVLLELLEGQRPVTLPVTGINWYEANAFARWAHKQLPYLHEWEVAARAGGAYNPSSYALRDEELKDGHLNSLEPLETLASTRDVLREFAPGIENLCSNALEWTRSPVSRNATYVPAEWNEPGFLLSEGQRYWIAGDQGSVFWPRRERGDYVPTSYGVGFRCALSVDDMNALVDTVDLTNIDLERAP